jgi:uncharacterized protein
MATSPSQRAAVRRQTRGSRLSWLGAVLLGTIATRAAFPGPTVRALDEPALREYAGVYRRAPDALTYLQLWSELTGKNQLVAFEESGAVRTLYPTDRDRFFAGPGAAVATSIEARVEFQRDAAGKIRSMTWRRDDGPASIAQRVEIERREDVSFTNGDVRLAGMLISPVSGRKHPALILVHASGAEDREYLLPFARFLIRRGFAILGFDKRGVGGSTGDWKQASFDDLAGDVVAAFEYLKTRADIDRSHIGLLGWSQAGWVMPLAAVRAKDIAFLISISGAGVSAAETTIDQLRRELTAQGMPPPRVDDIVGLTRLQYEYARTGRGWDEYAAARARIASRMGAPPDTIPGTPDHPYFGLIRRLYLYDPAPTLRQLQTPTLALFGELDNNILPEKNKAAWEAALRAGGHRDYALTIVAKANHAMLDAKAGNNAEMPSLNGFVPTYSTIVIDWLRKRISALSP